MNGDPVIAGKFQRLTKVNGNSLRCARNTPGTLTLPLAGECRVERKLTSRSFAALVVLLHVTVRMCLPFKFRVFDEWPDQLQAL